MLLEIIQREVDEFFIVCGDMELAGPFTSHAAAQAHLSWVLTVLKEQ